MKSRKSVFIMGAVMAFFAMALPVRAQNLAVSTDAVGYLNFGTINGEISYSVSRHWSTTASFRYNPFLYKADKPGETLSNRQRSFSAGARYWPWHVYSGWWLSGKLQYQEYNQGGIVGPETREGDRFGIGAAAGYTYMLGTHLNLEFAVGVWGGRDDYVKYDCPVCGLTVESGKGFFILPNDIIMALSYIF